MLASTEQTTPIVPDTTGLTPLPSPDTPITCAGLAEYAFDATTGQLNYVTDLTSSAAKRAGLAAPAAGVTWGSSSAPVFAWQYSTYNASIQVGIAA